MKVSQRGNTVSKVRIIVKRIFQPPIDIPASVRWATVEVESDELFQMLVWTGNEKGDDKYTSSTVVGAEAMRKSDTHNENHGATGITRRHF